MEQAINARYSIVEHAICKREVTKNNTALRNTPQGCIVVL